MLPRVTLKAIAAKAGVHLSTVSLALKNHPSLPEATRLRLQNLADEMGYCRDPLLSALIAYRSTNRPLSKQGVLAWVDLGTNALPARSWTHANIWNGAFNHAQKLGWNLQEFRPLNEGIALPQFSRILRTRGIQGLIIAPLPVGINSIELEWSWFSAVCPSHSLHTPDLHRILTNQAHNMRVLCQKLYNLGYRRPGFVITTDENRRTGHDWLSAFLGFQYSAVNLAIIPPLEQMAFESNGFLAWVRVYKPDVIIVTRPNDYIATLTAAGFSIPRDIGVASIRNPGFLGPDSMWGVNECFEEIGQKAIDVLVGMIHRNEKGVPIKSIKTFISGELQEGDTLRSQAV